MKSISFRPDSLLAPLSRREDKINGGVSLGLLAVTLPTVGYALTQLTHLMSGGNLEQAIRAFAR